MRHLVPTEGHEWRGSLIAIDGTFLYVGENRDSHDGSSIDRVYRYRLDRFEEIGLVLE
jgi:hypothetical protein